MAEQCAVDHPGRHRVLDGSPLVEDVHGVGLERQHLLGDAVPLGGVARVAAVRGVHADEHVVFDALLPERVELRQRERPRTAEAGHRGGTDQDRTGAALDRPVQLLDRLLDDGQRDDRRGEDAVLVVEPPHLVEPLVQRVDDDVDGDRVVAQPLLDEAGQRREHQRAVDSEFVHQLQPRFGLEEGRDGPHRLTEQLALALALRVAELEVLLPSARLGDVGERGVRNVIGDLTLDRDLGAAVDLDVLDDVLVLLGQVLGHRLGWLVQVVVRVEQRERDVDPV